MRARFAAVFAIATACTFPDITIVVEDDQSGGGAGGGSSPTVTTGDGGAPATTSTESTSMTTTSSSSSSMSNGGGGMGGSGGGECADLDGDRDPSILCGGTDCDDDGDGVMVEHEGCCTGGACDCNDGNADVFPGQTAWFSDPWDGANNYDYDCSLIPEARYTTECPQSGILSCGDGKRFKNAVGCGGSGTAQACSGLLGTGLGCTPVAGSDFTLVQECH